MKSPYAAGLAILLLILITYAAYQQVQDHEFTIFDDNDYVTENVHVQSGLTPKSVRWAFKNIGAGFWFPVTWLSHMTDYEIFALNPRGHHLTNLLFHIANALLLFIVLYRMTGELWKGAFVALLFSLHPLNVEPVAWISSRKDVLSTLFWMLAIWSYVVYAARPSVKRYLLLLLLFLLGLMSKPMVMTLPVVLLLLDLWPLQRYQFKKHQGSLDSSGFPDPDRRFQKKNTLFLLLEKIPFLVFSLAFCLITYYAEHQVGALPSFETFPFEVRTANAVVSYIQYIGKMIFPIHLACFYPYPAAHPSWQTIGAGLLLCVISLFAVKKSGRHPYLIVGWLWYLITLLPVIGLIQVGSHAMADRYAYIPLIGLFIMVAWGIPALVEKWRYRSVFLPLTAGFILLSLSLCTWVQLKYWKNSTTLFEHALQVTRNNHVAHNNLGLALARTGRLNEAIRHYHEALRIKPQYSAAHNNLGLAFSGLKRFDRALFHYREALRINPWDEHAHCNLGVLLAMQKKDEEAIDHFKAALRIKPDFHVGRINLGFALARNNKYDEGIKHIRKVLEENPRSSQAHFSLGLVFLWKGDRDSALKQYKVLKALDPALADTLLRMIER